MDKPIILITGASGGIGSALCGMLTAEYHVIGLDIKPCPAASESFECDLTSEDAVKLALRGIKDKHGAQITSVIHLAAYFDFTGEEHPLYQKVTIDGTRHMLSALQDFEVERFIYASTMLVHEASVPGHKITEETPIKPGWAYPKSKAKAEEVIQQEAGDIPYTIARLAGVYNDQSAVPTLSYQIARIYERELKSHLYAGDLMAGQAFLHRDDMLALFNRIIKKRRELPKQHVILAGEEQVMGYQALQNRIGTLIHGDKEWKTISLPEEIAKPGAWLETKAEPIIPDAIDQGEKPFIRAFMIDLASDHYDVDISKAKQDLDWQPKHSIYHGLQKLIENLKKDPAEWYEKNGITAPGWLQTANEKNVNPHKLREQYKALCSTEHRSNLWAHFLNMGLAFWLITSPFILGYQSEAMVWSDMISGGAVAVFSFISLSQRYDIARWICAVIGLWVLSAPLVFWAPTAAAYLNGSIIGMLIIGFAVCVRPAPGVSPTAALTGPTIPPGWEFTPSGWFQRLPIIILAFVGFFISRYLCAYQLGHIDAVWEPFFAGSAANPQNGTEEIITSSVSEAWPVPDAGLGALTYALEIVTGLIGSTRRWRTMPWLVMLFGIMIVPLGIVSITFIIIQPIVLGTWCTLCLIAAAAMLIQIPYSLDELVATCQFLWRCKKQGQPLLRVFFVGDTDEGEWENIEDDFQQPPSAIMGEMLSGGVNIPWNLALCFVIGTWLMFTRLTVGADGTMANADHLMGALVVTTVVTAWAESARAVRFIIPLFGLCLLVTPFVYGEHMISMATTFICGALLIALSWRRGPVYNHYGTWDKYIV